MGLHTNDPYLHGTLSTLGPKVMSALQVAAQRLDGNDADAAAMRWFGDNSPNYKRQLARQLRQMRSVINVNTIYIGSNDLRHTTGGANPLRRVEGQNALAATAAAPVRMGGTIQTAGKILGTGDQRSIMLDEGFHRLPNYLPIIPAPPPLPGAAPGPAVGAASINANGWYQSKLNTLIHELSHLLIGTADVAGAGGTAYGTQRAAALAAASPANAKNNAENWGIFVEACGHHKLT